MDSVAPQRLLLSSLREMESRRPPACQGWRRVCATAYLAGALLAACGGPPCEPDLYTDEGIGICTEGHDVDPIAVSTAAQVLGETIGHADLPESMAADGWVIRFRDGLISEGVDGFTDPGSHFVAVTYKACLAHTSLVHELVHAAQVIYGESTGHDHEWFRDQTPTLQTLFLEFRNGCSV